MRRLEGVEIPKDQDSKFKEDWNPSWSRRYVRKRTQEVLAHEQGQIDKFRASIQIFLLSRNSFDRPNRQGTRSVCQVMWEGS